MLTQVVHGEGEVGIRLGSLSRSFFIFNFIYLFLTALGLRCYVQAFSSCGEWGLLFAAVCGLLIAVASRCRARGLGVWASVVVARRLSSCGTRALEHRLGSCGARALVAPRHVGSSQTRARTHVPCIGRRILNQCATREVRDWSLS